jgi:diguanylate cyclase (GGDEF)-like protein/PAS domain S-box-containing protein
MFNSDSLFDIYKSLFEYNHDACYALDLEGNFRLFNNAAIEITGYSVDEALQMSFILLIHEEFREKTISFFRQVLDGKTVVFNTTITHKLGHKVDLSITAVPIYRDNVIYGVVGMAQDITEKNKLELLLNGQNKVLEMVAKGSTIEKVLEQINQLFESVLYGGICSILLIKENKLLIGASTLNDYLQEMGRASINSSADSYGTFSFKDQKIVVSDIMEDPIWGKYTEIALKYGIRVRWAAPVFDNQANIIGIFSVYFKEVIHPSESDIQVIEKATYLTSLTLQHYISEEKINYMAFHDALTGLPNRRLFDMTVQSTLTENQATTALMFLDLDRFKLINDSLGHTVGDKLLQIVANRLQSTIQEQYMVSRQGGDEFTILIDQVTTPEIENIANRIIKSLEKPINIDEHEIYITPSIGISLYPKDGKNADELIRKADLAMYHAKKQGRNNFQFYNDLFDHKNSNRLEFERGLRKASTKGEFSLQYQPIIDLSTNQLAGVEALIRWRHGRLGMISPKDFIPIAEETGLIIPIGEWVIRSACYQLKQWVSDGIHVPCISVNISIRQFYQPNLITMIQHILEETGIQPQSLTIEITESMTMEVETTITILQQLKKLGVNISIDDFGTGYSSLSYIKAFPIDYIKIDQSFIRDITHSKSSENIATTILLMAQNLGLKVIAEGVETEQQLEILQQYKCNQAQGYLFSKPLYADEFKNWSGTKG